jgi:membrane protein implicated in regulation of membrane protease activity
MTWWFWLLCGLLLLVVELSIPGGFYFLFFGTAALVVGVLVALGMDSDWLQFVVFGILAVVSLATLRGTLVRRLGGARGGSEAVDAIVGQFATIIEDVAPRGPGKAELRGTLWSVHNTSEQVLSKGQRVRVVRLDGLTLLVQPA